MQTARRLYLAVVSAITLGLLVGGLIGLVRVVLETIAGTPGIVGADRTREDLSLAIALTAVGAPLWLAHTWYAERLARRPGPAGEAERQSPLRSLYLSGAASVLLLLCAVELAGLLREAIGRLLAAAPGTGIDPIEAGARAAILLPAWVVFARLRLADLAAGPLHGPAAALSRLALYGAALGGLVVLAMAGADLIVTVLRLLVGRPSLAGEVDWWRLPVAADLGQGTVGALVAVLHLRFADRLAGSAGTIGDEERRSRVRAGWRPLFVLIATVAVATALGDAASRLLAFALIGEEEPLIVLEDLLGAVLGVVPFVLVAWWAAGAARTEAFATGGAARRGAVTRLIELAVATVGIALLGVGSAFVLGLLVEIVGGGSSTIAGAEWRRELSQWLGYLAIGLPLWLVAWLRLERRRVADRTTEAASASRQGYLLLVSGAALVAGASAVALVLYRTIRVVLGLDVGDLVAELSSPLGVAVVAVLLLAYHALAIRTDARERGTAEVGVPAVAPGPPRALELLLLGPTDGDADAVRERLVAALPPGWSIGMREREPEPGTEPEVAGPA